MNFEIDLSAPLTLEQLRQWKGELEDAAREQNPDAAAAAAQLLQVAQQASQPQVLALAHWIAGNVNMFLSQAGQALQHYQQAEALYGEMHDALSAARLSPGKLEVLCDLGRYEEAIAAGEAAVAVLQASEDESDQWRLAGLTDALGANYERLGWLVEALDCSQRAWRWWNKQPNPEARIQAAQKQTNAAVVQTLLGQFVKAQQDFVAARAVLALVQADEAVKADIARIDMNMAWLEVTRRNTPDIAALAFAQAQASRQLIDPTLDAKEFAFFDLLQADWQLSQQPDSPEAAQAMMALAQRCQAAGLVHESARANIQLARALLGTGDSASARELCNRQLAAASQRGDVEIAHAAGIMLSQAVLAAGQIDEAVIELEHVIARTEATRSRFASDEFRAGYLDDKLLAYQLLTDIHLRASKPAQAFAVMEQAKARTLAESLGAVAVQATPQLNAVAEVAAQLRPDEMLMSYAWVKDRLWAFLISKDGLHDVVALNGELSADQLRSDLARLSAIARLPAAQAERFAQQHIRSAQTVLGRWHQQFFEPLRSAVAPYARLIICPDQLLGLIPFASLYHAQSGRYLVEDHDVVIAPSATTWAHISPSHHATPKQCLVAGWSSGGRLPQAVSEAQAVATDLAQAGCAVQTLLEGAATLDAFVQNISQQDLIYVASHGLYRPDAPARSYIELADGLLTTDHIAGLKLQAACVILSACETGVGHLSGNELMGFVRAFLHAGARSVIATHWPVDDAAMKALMARFTTCLGPNFDVTSAFCEAQRAMMRKAKDDQNAHRLAHPYYWGALSVIGRS